MALSEIFAGPSDVVTAGESDDAGYRGAGLALAAMPFLYIVAVLVCHAVGTLLLSLRLLRFKSFLAGAIAVALLLGLAAGILLGVLNRFGLSDLPIFVAIATLLFLVSGLPAALCWWFFAVRPHNISFNPDALKGDG